MTQGGQGVAVMHGLGAVQAWDVVDRTWIVTTKEAEVHITPLAPDVVRVQMLPFGAVPPSRSYAVVASPDAWPAVELAVGESADGITLQTTFHGAPGLTVAMERATARLRVVRPDGSVVVADRAGGGLGILRRGGGDGGGLDILSNGGGDGGGTGAGAQAGSASGSRWGLEAPFGARYYGFGQKQGFLDKRGQRMSLWATDEPLHILTNDALYQAIPFFLTMNGDGASAGVFVDCPGRVTYDVAKSDPAACVIDTACPTLDAYVFTGPGPKVVIERYTQLTGRMALPPLWALGYQQCRYSYYPESRVREVAKEMRERDIPCDAIYLDIHYMDGYRVFTWDKERFPDPKQLVADLAADGFKTITIVDPGVKVDGRYRVFQEGIRDGHFVCHPDGELFIGTVWPGRTAFPDFLRADTRRWWGDLHKELLQDIGIAGIWNDMNEPSCFARNTFPDEVLQGEAGEQVRHADVHNVYGQTMAMATYDALLRLQPDKRPFLLTRSGYAGVQRYAAVWMGDNHSWWEHLLMAMPMSLGMGLSGVPFVGTDIGGFQGDADGELFARWIQMGALMPFSRNHAALDSVDQEPWSFGPEVEAIAREFLQLRYRLLPFLYNEFYKASVTGLPIMRPLLLEYPADPHTANLSDQFLLGEDVLVCPVYQPGATKRMVYLPPGEWVDFWTGARHLGGQHVVADAPLTRMPLYVRAGSIVPMEPVVNHTGARDGQELFLHVYVPTWAEAGEEAAGVAGMADETGTAGVEGETGMAGVTGMAVPDKTPDRPGGDPGGGPHPASKAKGSGEAKARVVGQLVLYEDAGEGFGYKAGEFATTAVTVARDGHGVTVTVADPEGGFVPPRRHVTVHVHWGAEGAHPAPGEVRVDGVSVPSGRGPLGEVTATVPTPDAKGFTLTIPAPLAP